MNMIRIISGTNRADSNTRKISNEIRNIYSQLNTPCEIIDLKELPEEIFTPLAYSERPKSFEKFSAAIKTADALVIVIPEYNGSFPGVFKYFIDMLDFPESLQEKPCCFVGVAAGMWGALRSIEQLEDIFVYRNAFVFPKSVFINNVNSFLDSSGHIINGEILERLKNQATDFIDFVNRFRKK